MLERLQPRGVDVVLDAGCGTGRVTERLLEENLATVVLGGHLERRSPAEQRMLVSAVAAGLPEPVVDYVRLNIVARKGGG